MAAAYPETIQSNSQIHSKTDSWQQARVQKPEAVSIGIPDSSTKYHSKNDKTDPENRKPRTLGWFRRRRDEGLSARWMSRHSGLSLRTVYNRLTLIAKGKNAASEVRRPGRPSKITEAHKLALYAILTHAEKSPKVSASERNLQFRKDVKLVTGIAYSSIQLYRLRKRLIEHPPVMVKPVRAEL